MNIPVVVVDDREEDRYLVKRHISKSDGFDALVEVDSGDKFLERYFNESVLNESVSAAPENPVSKKIDDVATQGTRDTEALVNRDSDRTLLVLMDINMPGLDGFETIEEAQRRSARGSGPQRIIYLMYTSSENSKDKQRAGELDFVKGYLAKPLNKDAVGYIRDLYLEQAQQH